MALMECREVRRENVRRATTIVRLITRNYHSSIVHEIPLQCKIFKYNIQNSSNIFACNKMQKCFTLDSLLLKFSGVCNICSHLYMFQVFVDAVNCGSRNNR